MKSIFYLLYFLSFILLIIGIVVENNYILSFSIGLPFVNTGLIIGEKYRNKHIKNTINNSLKYGILFIFSITLSALFHIIIGANNKFFSVLLIAVLNLSISIWVILKIKNEK